MVVELRNEICAQDGWERRSWLWVKECVLCEEVRNVWKCGICMKEWDMCERVGVCDVQRWIIFAANTAFADNLTKVVESWDRGGGGCGQRLDWKTLFTDVQIYGSPLSAWWGIWWQNDGNRNDALSRKRIGPPIMPELVFIKQKDWFKNQLFSNSLQKRICCRLPNFLQNWFFYKKSKNQLVDFSWGDDIENVNNCNFHCKNMMKTVVILPVALEGWGQNSAIILTTRQQL